jgi:ABC-type dipeptide/oligopeptide/nickel transport system ATPase component
VHPQKHIAAAESRPSLVIADEPTAALDIESALEVMKLLRRLVLELNAALMIITHDSRLLAMIAERVLVVHAGRRGHPDGFA